MLFAGYQNANMWLDDVQSSPTSQFTVTAQAGAGGSISPPGTRTYAYGTDSDTFTITPAVGHVITDVKVDGVSVGVVTSYQFTDLRTDHSISATFGTPPEPEMPVTVDCGDCHDDHGDPPPCDDCHGLSEYHPGTPSDMHTPADVTGCTPCHNASLTQEHYGKQTGGGSPIECMTCHGSSDPDVIAAIGSGNSACSACHDVGAGGHESAHTGIEQDGCSACHSFSDQFFTNHAAVDCDQCHTSPTAINPALDYSCGSCHTPSSTPWSLALGAFAAIGLIVVPVTRRRSA